MRTRPSVLILLCLAVTAILPALPASAATPPAGATHTEVYFPSRDGTMLHGDLLKPTAGCPAGGCPVIVSIGPYYGRMTQGGTLPGVPPSTASGPSSRFYDFINFNFPGKGNIFQQGYAWIQVDSRGYGVSGGCNDYGGPGEQMDAAAAVDWAAQQPWSNGKVGMWGKSYDAWTQVMALKMNPTALEAVVIQSPIIDGYGIAYVNGVHHDAIWYATTGLYQLYDYGLPGADQVGNPNVVWSLAGNSDRCWERQHAYIAAGWDRDGLPSAEYWRQRDLRPAASRNDDVAVLYSHGFNDVNTKPDQIFGVYEPLNDLPKSNHRAWFGEWAHYRGNEANHTGRGGFLLEALDWFDHYLRGKPFTYGVNEQNVVEVQDQEGRWRTEAQYPPADVNRISMPIRNGSYTDNNSQSATAGYWTYSQPLEHDQRIAGEPEVTMTADLTAPWGNAIVVLYDFDPATGEAKEINRGAYRFESDGPVTFKLHPRDHIVRAGHRLAVHVTSGHPQFLPHQTGQSIGISNATIAIPFLTWERVLNLGGGRASSSSREISPAFNGTEALTWPLPGPMTPYPTDDGGATRERIQPTASTPVP